MEVLYYRLQIADLETNGVLNDFPPNLLNNFALKSLRFELKLDCCRLHKVKEFVSSFFIKT